MMLLGVLLSINQVWGEDVTTTLTQTNIYNNGTGGGTGYKSISLTNDDGYTFTGYAIKNQHSNATSTQHYLQIRSYNNNTAYYISIPEMPGAIQSITMTVSGSSQPMTGGGCTATIYFSNSQNSTDASSSGVSGTGANSVTIDASSLNLTSGYITASAAVRIWSIAVTYVSGSSVTYTDVL